MRTRGAVVLSLFLVSSPAVGGTGVWSGNGPYPGQVDFVGFIPATPPLLLIKTGAGALLQSTDEGTTWATPAGLPARVGHTSLWVPPLATSTAYVATGPATIGVGAGVPSLFKTTDGGATWATLAVPPPSRARTLGYVPYGRSQEIGQTSAVAGDPADPDVVYTAVGKTISKSTDGGETWTSSTLDHVSFSIWSLAVDPEDSSIVFEGNGSNGVRRSTDGGVTWTAVLGEIPDFNPEYFLTFVPGSPERLFANRAYTLARSTDSGTTWTGLTLDLVPTLVVSFLPDPENETRLLIGSDSGIFRSTDAGSTWDLVTDALPWVRSFARHPGQPNVLFAASNAGLARSTDGGDSWSLLPAEPPADVWLVAADPYSPRTFFAAASGNLLRTSDGGSTWQPLAGFGHRQARTLLSIASTPPTLLALAESLLRSTDSGESWQAVDGTWFGIAQVPGSRGLVYGVGAGSYFYRSVDAGRTWSITNATLQFDGTNDTIGVDPLDPELIYDFSWSGLSKSPDGGATWTFTANPSQISFTTIAIDPKNTSRLWAGAPSGLLRSTDAGGSWSDLTAALPSSHFVNQLIADGPTGKLFLASDSGTFESTDGGDSWAAFGSFPDGVIAQSLAQSPADPAVLVCGTPSRGVFTLTISDYPIAVGDVNADGRLDVLDVFALVDFLFADASPPGGRPDANGDGHIDVVDVFYLINSLFAGGPAPV